MFVAQVHTEKDTKYDYWSHMRNSGDYMQKFEEYLARTRHYGPIPLDTASHGTTNYRDTVITQQCLEFMLVAVLQC